MKRLAIFVLIFVFLAIGTAYAQIAPALSQRMDEADGQYLPIIVGFEEEFDVNAIVATYELRGDEELVRDQVIEILKDKAVSAHYWVKGYCEQRDSEIRNFKSFWIANMVSMEATPAAIREIAQQPGVNVIFLDEDQMFVDYIQGTPMRDAWGLKKIKSDEVNKKFKGKDVLVAVIDTGVNYNHVELKGRVLLGKDTINNDMDPLDDNGHGSHCAGTIAGTTYGVAPEAQILAVKVLSGSGSGSWQSVADGVQFVADYKDAKGKRVDVASMSLGGGAPIQAVLRTAFDNAVKLGVIFAIAAGNSGPSAKTIGTPGDQKDIVSVGATDINDNIASFSSRGPVVAYGDSYIKPDISAPGVNITSCWKGSATASNTISGTSMATPHVAGLMALIMQAKTGLKFEQMKSILETTALDLGAAGLDTSFGWGRVQADKAVETAEMLASRMDIEKDVNFPINPDGTISMNLTKENPLWEMKATVSVTILNPEGIYNGTFSLIKNGKNTQKGAINNLPAGQLHNVGTFTLYYGENTLQLEGTYTGESKVAEGTLRVKATLQD